MEKNISIGQRYIPKHCGHWNNSLKTEYEQLSVVYYNGRSYTSKRNVPIGTDINDSKYWVSSADYNEQVSIYENNVREYNKKVEHMIMLYDELLQKINALTNL